MTVSPIGDGVSCTGLPSIATKSHAVRSWRLFAGEKNGPTRLGQGQKVGFAHAPVQEQSDLKDIARPMSRDQTQKKNQLCGPLVVSNTAKGTIF